jgi:hypothetical protein
MQDQERQLLDVSAAYERDRALWENKLTSRRLRRSSRRHSTNCRREATLRRTGTKQSSRAS